MNLTFTPATPPQHDRIEALLRAAFTPYVRMVGYELSDRPYPWLRQSIEDGLVYVGLDQDEIVGVVTVTPDADALVIDNVAVTTDRQGAGIGSWLVDNIEVVARSNRVKALWLHTPEVREDLLRFYRRHGFEEVRRALPDHGQDTNLRVHMKKELT